MTSPVSLHDDDALWFPVAVGAGESFSRPIGADGAARHEGEEDGIGLPRRTGTSDGGPKGPKKRGGVRASSWLWLTLWGAAAAGIVVYAARKDIAAEIAQGWLSSQGAHGRVHFDQLSLSHAEGSLLIGPPGQPDFSLDHFEVDYTLNPFARAGLPLARVTRARLVHPVMQMALHDGKLSYGSLDRLVQNILSAPPSKAPPPHDILVENLSVRLATDYGPMRGLGNISLHDGQLTSLNLNIPAGHFSGPLGEGDLGEAQILARSVQTAQNGEQLHLQARLTGDNWRIGENGSPVEDVNDGEMVAASDVALTLDALLPYRKSKSLEDAFSGASEATLTAQSAMVATGGTVFDGLDATLKLAGSLKSGASSGGFNGAAYLSANAGAVHSGVLDARSLHLTGDKLALQTQYNNRTGVTLSLNGPVNGQIGHLQQGDLAIDDAAVDLGRLVLVSDSGGAQADFDGQMRLGRLASGGAALTQARLRLTGEGRSDAASGGWSLTAQSDIDASGHYGGLDAAAQGRAARVAVTAAPGAPVPAQPADAMVALDRGFDHFALHAQGIGLNLASGGGDTGTHITLRLKDQLALDLAGGGQVIVKPVSGKALFDSQSGGALTAALSGPDLPQGTLDVSGFGLDPHGNAVGQYHLAGRLDVAPVAGAQFDGQGRFATTPDGGLTASLTDPASFTAASAELGDHVEHLKATIIPDQQPLLRMTPQGWHVAASYDGLSFDAPNEQVAFGGGKGDFTAFSIPGSEATGLTAALLSGQVSDALTGAATRFHPLQIQGAMKQNAQAMTGRFYAATPQAKGADGQPLRIAQIDLDNGVTSGRGSLTFKTLDLSFSPQGLQPAQLTPMASAFSHVTGQASFTGGFNWVADKVTSGGVLTLDGLDFTGATGVSQGLNGKLSFTSLSPLTSGPDQRISVATMQAGLPLSDLEVGMQFFGDRLAIDEAHVMTPGGQVRFEPMDIPFDTATPIHGTIAFDGLDFGKIVAATSLATSMSFDGTLTGRLPFAVDNGHFTVSNGSMASDRPGRISVKRQAVTGVDATGNVTSKDIAPGTAAVAAANADAVAASDPNFNPFQDLAYQAIEHISYDEIDAKVNSQAGGILDNSFHIKGSFDPPQKQKATISLFDYISGAWMKKPIKLPSGTPVELYLDVPVNLDEILGDLGAYSSDTAGK
ncbi:YdbH domain-containing protein [Asticcacaulis sp. EMRT-3]|uniref:intermembrane phospholipid transport protein YdbH family protein n=1 Tax=Asticcacaulis sp. EMRT-3 TaxID=3040349 RepID=UPI0024AFA01C|nr:YdbH domain-containing protein [Asticcacaulis sp. EMRT-3]MDI7776223.1 YdbH domain-containing protein [Asticcacaulis sp. EMRT-3]